MSATVESFEVKGKALLCLVVKNTIIEVWIVNQRRVPQIGVRVMVKAVIILERTERLCDCLSMKWLSFLMYTLST